VFGGYINMSENIIIIIIIIIIIGTVLLNILSGAYRRPGAARAEGLQPWSPCGRAAAAIVAAYV
jgi:hypothetical protein